MSRIIPFGNIPDSTVFPDGIFRLKVRKLEEKQTKEREGKVQKLMFALTSQVVEPASHKGLLYSEWFVVGTDDDPEAEELATWQTSIGGRGLKRLTKALGVPFGDEEDSEGFCKTVEGAEYLATIVQKVEPDKKKDASGVEYDNPYKGQVRNNTTAYWKLGEKDAGLTDGSTAAKPAAAKKTTTTKATEAKAPPSDDVTCTACRKRVPRKELKVHVEQHMADLAKAGGGDSTTDDE